MAASARIHENAVGQMRGARGGISPQSAGGWCGCVEGKGGAKQALPALFSHIGQRKGSGMANARHIDLPPGNMLIPEMAFAAVS